MVTAGSLRAGGLFIFAKEMINIAIKLATSITYTADGSQTNFSIPFDYLRPSFVHVAVNDAEISKGFTISNRMVMFDSAPTKDAVVHIYRNTPTTRLVSWADASILKAIDMTIAEVQQLHILEEGQDWSKNNSIALDAESDAWQGRNHRVSNVSDPTEAQDVVTKNYMENVQGGFVIENTKLKDEATRQAGLAKDEMLKAQQYANDARDAKELAKRWAEAADSPDYTTSKSAKTWAEEAKDTAMNLGNPVVNVAEDKGTVTVSKSDGSSSSFTIPPTGSIIAFAGGTLPKGYLFCDGSKVSRTTYKKLFNVIGTTYGAGNGSTTFTLPNLIDRFLEGSSAAGSYREAGLPNVTGSFIVRAMSGNQDTLSSAKGAFKLTRNATADVFAYSIQAASNNTNTNDLLQIDASRNSNIYGKSNVVQPSALNCKYIIKY